MDPADIQLPESPAADDASPATVGVLKQSPIVLAAAQDAPAAFLALCRRFVIGIINLFVPAPVRQNWIFIFTTIYNRIAVCPVKYRYGFSALIASIALAEWQQPGYMPRPRYLSNAIFGFLCATLLVFGVLATADFIETQKWPWQEDGWVWPWQAWLWQGTAYDLGASTNTWAPDLRSPPPATSPFAFQSSPPVISSSSMNPSTQSSDMPVNKATRFEFSMPPPPTISKQSMIIPPTPQLPGGLRPIYLPPPTPAQIHRSGILGASPMAPKFKHFSGNYFKEQQDDMKAISEWSRSSNKPLGAFKGPIVPEKRAGADYENEKPVKRSFTSATTQADYARMELLEGPNSNENAGNELDYED